MIITTTKSATAPTLEQITKRAHEIWLAEGCPEGRALEHWQRAEKELGMKAVPAPATPGDGNAGKNAGQNRLKLSMPARKPAAQNPF
jgi:hypothetical protein